MALKIKTAPAAEPISLTEAKLHLRIESEALADNLTTVQTIAPGAHVVAPLYSLKGVGVPVSGYNVVVNLVAGTNGTGGTVDVKLQQSEDDVDAHYSDVPAADFTAFAQVTEATDNDTFESEYKGRYAYIRMLGQVANATCSFGVNVIKKGGATSEDNEITKIIKAARSYCEKYQNRAYITQWWDFWLDEFPGKDNIELPLPPIQEPVVIAGSFVTGTVYRILSVGTTDFTLVGAASSAVGVCFKATGAGVGTGTATASGVITYYGTDDTAYYASGLSLDKEDQYSPKLYLRYNESWPSTTLRPHNGICVTFAAGYGDAGSSVPENVILAMLLLITDFYEHRGEVITGTIVQEVKRAVDALLSLERVF